MTSSHDRTPDEIRTEILALVDQYFDAVFGHLERTRPSTPVPVTGKVFDASELRAAVEASLDFWLTTGRFADALERALAAKVGARHAMLVNSGSSANLLAVAALTSPQLGDRRLCPGDEVITLAAGFPTTVNPIVQAGGVPVFVDIELPSLGVSLASLERALSDRTKAVIFAHTLGVPFDAGAVRTFCDAHGLWFIEDCCDALGAAWQGRNVGTFGDFATLSFYPAHHITTGEGGCVLTSSPKLRSIAESFRDWGRDCWCQPGCDNTCGKRFVQQHGQLPFGYDHKYTFSHIGYNLKMTDLQAAVGLAQIRKLDGFIAARRENHALLLQELRSLDTVFEFVAPPEQADPSWFGFPMIVRSTAPFDREQFIRFLDARGVATRLLFGGNLTKQPAYQHVNYRCAEPLPNSDRVMNDLVWIGCFPGLQRHQLQHMIDTIFEFVSGVGGPVPVTRV